ncbi:MAG: ComEC/Rec2 family competence protein [Muribaculaceae bacterium]
MRPYRSAGVAHILAISGLHISIFAGIILFY